MSDRTSLISQAFAGAGSGTGEAAAKASPGLAVSGLYIMGFDINTWVSICTLLYLFIMIAGAMPRAVEGIRYLRHLYAAARKPPQVPVTEVDVTGETVGEKIRKHAPGGEDRP